MLLLLVFESFPIALSGGGVCVAESCVVEGAELEGLVGSVWLVGRVEGLCGGVAGASEGSGVLSGDGGAEPGGTGVEGFVGLLNVAVTDLLRAGAEVGAEESGAVCASTELLLHINQKKISVNVAEKNSRSDLRWLRGLIGVWLFINA
jgi:hypothetical protein